MFANQFLHLVKIEVMNAFIKRKTDRLTTYRKITINEKRKFHQIRFIFWVLSVSNPKKEYSLTQASRILKENMGRRKLLVKA